MQDSQPASNHPQSFMSLSIVLRKYQKDHLVRCVKCSFVFAGVKPTLQELDTVYGGYSRDIVPTDATRKKMRDIAENLKSLSSARRVLDIGCGEGNLLSIFKTLGCEVFGTEYDPRTEQICRGKGITMLRGGVMPALEECGNREEIDCAILTEVIEHINNPIDVIDNITRLLRPSGLLYVTTPNFASLERRLIGPQWGMICYPEHISFYTPRTLDRLLTSRGYTKVSLRTENISVFRIAQFVNRRKAAAGEASNLNPEAAAAAAQNAVEKNPLLHAAKVGVNAVLNLAGLGTSMMAIYRRAGD